MGSFDHIIEYKSMIIKDPKLDLRKEFLERLKNGCSGCEFDEAEGGLIDHCDTCCRKITTLAYGLFIG